jgi:CHAT domain-containing protein
MGMRKRFHHLPAAAFALLGLSLPAGAATHEQIVENCRQTVGRPLVMACMGGRRDDGLREECRKKATPAVRACVTREEQKIAAGKSAPAAPKAPGAAADATAGPRPTAFVAPPRTIADVTAVLDHEKPDAARIAKAKAAADADPPKNLSTSQLVQFYYNRANARGLLSRNRDALADGLKAMEIGRGGIDLKQVARIRQFVGMQYQAVGDPKQAMATYQSIINNVDQPGARGTFINASRNVAQTLVSMGDVIQADAVARRVAARVQEARGSPHPNWRNAYSIYGNSWESDADSVRGLIFEARGQYREAEGAYMRAEAFRRASLKNLDRFDFPPPPAQVVMAADRELMSAGRVKAKQGRLNEAESDIRRALLSALKTVGKYNASIPGFILGLADILVEQGRYEEAEKLVRSALEIQRTLGVGDDTPTSANIMAQLGGVLTLQGKEKDAATVYAQLETAVSGWEAQRRDVFLLNSSRITALYSAGRLDAGIAAAQALLKRQVARTGESHFDTASARGVLAIGYALAGRAEEALKEFRAAIPIMMTAARENAEDDETTVIAARSLRLQSVVEGYMRLLAQTSREVEKTGAETFALADAVRGQSVQKALAASSARMTAKDPALADLARNEQDLGKQIGAQLGILNNMLALPPSERDEKDVRATNAALEKLRAERVKARQEINRRFPTYADLVDPKPPSVEQVRAVLLPGEALISFYLGREASFVWAVPKDGAVAFAAIPASALDIEAKVRALREALEPQAAMVSDIPPFDTGLAHELYAQLLQPVEHAWKPARKLIVVTNGALGLLPLSLLPTAPVKVAEGGPAFSGYRDVPWLARTHAVTLVPSVAALRTLRALPPGKPTRSTLIAFGDPYFSEKQAAESGEAPIEVADAGGLATRGVPLRRRSSPQTRGVDSAELALLPRLPDTADELRSMALALQTNAATALHLGKAANEKTVKTTDLSNFKIVAFATHGLVPGELDGLIQPALALSAPQVAGVDGDGLLTMEEILTLKLDADWVVLSACNTGSGAGAGAEAASGLGRAFFYAGTRAILVTNWSVHSQSARELVTDLFRRQATQSGLSRGEALQQAMLGLIDGKGFVDDKGQTVFSYAHPLFWAPYSIIGDGS